MNTGETGGHAGRAIIEMKREYGFTLLELLVVMTLITLILSISAISFVNSLPAGRFHATVRELSATIRHAGHLYRQSGRKQVVSINMESGKYGIVGRGEKDIPPGINVRVIDPLEEEISEGTFKIVFSVSEGPGGEKIVLWDDKREAQVTVDPVVGAVVVKQSSS